ncbi:hypothetical protein [Chryseobacterium aureum]|uniref:hypothetical protein n=1 Tax=Chryseobacterium aureum TaxID=2497456 RepID=UPI000F86E9A1|nr:hypothetical protein [Chryseobacterium aureum]
MKTTIGNNEFEIKSRASTPSKTIDLKKIPQKTAEITEIKEDNTEMNVIIIANAQFGVPNFKA